MRIRDVFAQNLRLLCQRYGSLTQAADELGVTKQQLNTYLGADHFPSDRVLDRICKVFGVNQLDLVDPGFDPRQSALREKYSPTALAHIEPIKHVDLSDGLFDLYMSDPSRPDMVARTLVAIKRNTLDITEFRRITGYYAAGEPSWRYYRGNHVGIVVQSQGVLYLNGFNRVSANEPSLIVLERIPTARPLFSGRAIVMDINGQGISAAVMIPAPKLSNRALLKRIQLLSLSDNTIAPIVREHILKFTDGIEIENSDKNGYEINKKTDF